ncbi:MAG: zinc-binding dehydrogenase [Planctomycetes bacterium]|nr:zinc-binding dehydrogenase [Planctomycetota bacterium]
MRFSSGDNAIAADSLAAVFHAAGRPLELRRFALPELAAGELLVRVTCATLCGSDLHTYQGRRPAPTPTVLGHEIIGRIEALGPGEPVCDDRNKVLQIGQRVTWSIAASCGRCFFCQRDLPQKCERLFKYGHEAINERHPLSGGLAEFCHLAPGTAIVSLPDQLPDLVACPANCATATVTAALRVGGGCRDQTVLVQGAGMLGLAACALAQGGGASRVIVCDVDENRLAPAKRFGAHRCVCVARNTEALGTTVKEITNGRGVDLAIELSGSAGAIEAGLPLLRIGGRYVLVGAVFPGPPVSLSAEQIVRGCLSIHGVHNYAPQDLSRAVAFLAENHRRYPFDELVTETFPLAEAERAFQYAIETRPLRVAIVNG